MTLESHPLADLIPPMSEEDYGKLRDDIKENGLLEAITLYEGMILDGRHRYQACVELDIEPLTYEYGGDTPAQYVISLNVNRRHLTLTQRADIALAALPHYEEEARVRQQDAAERGRQTQQDGSAPKDADPSSPAKKATAEAAADVGVSSKTIERLKRVKRDAPDLYEKVTAGEMKISAADTIAAGRGQGARPGPKPRDITQPYEINSDKSRVNAEATKRRLEALIAALTGHATGLQGFDTPKAMATATPEELRGWVRALDEAITEFRGLRSTLKEGANNGIEERSKHPANTSA